MFRRQRLYIQVAETLTEQILSGKIHPGEKLKTEAELCDEFGVSRATIREALGRLESRGLIARKHGIGSFVLGTVGGVVAGLETLESFTDTIRRSGHEACERILSISKVKIKGELAAKMETDVGCMGYEVRTFRLSDGVPVNYSIDTLHAEIVPDIELLYKRKEYESLLDFLSEELAIFAKYSLMYLDAIEAPDEVAEILQVSPKAPLLYLDGLVRQENGRCVYNSSNYFVTGGYKFTIVRKR